MPLKKEYMPSSLTHFTTLEGLIGIIDNGELWASNVSFLNDRRELSHGLDASIDAIKVFHTSKTYKRWHTVLDRIVNEFRSGIVPHTYAICLCTRPDLLSQWRGYGGTIQGVSITFERAKLTEQLEPERAHLYRVHYSNILTKKKLGQRLSSQLDDLDEKSPALDQKAMELVARRLLSRLLPQFKHLGFMEEREWRYVVQQATVRSDVCYRARGNVVVPYIKLGPGKSGESLPIKFITVGPGKDQLLTAKSIELFLSTTKYSAVPIKLSSVPFRA